MSNSLRIVPLGGMGNVTKNMFVYEYQNQYLIVDCGIGFPDSTMLGIDILIPDTRFLADKTHHIVGMLLTHAHDDHIAGLPYILPQLPVEMPIYGSKLTIGFAKDRLKEFDLHAKFHPVPDTSFRLGPFTIDAIRMTHSVPDSRHYAISTKTATVYHGSDFKFDLNPIDGNRPDFQKIAQIGARGVTALLSDCLNAELQTFSKSESALLTTYYQEMKDVQGKIIVTAMSSNIHRIQAIIDVAAGFGRKVAFLGRSIEQNVRTASSLGFLKLPKNVIHKRKINKLRPEEVCVIVAGSQGQMGSSLTRAAAGEHDLLTINPEDKVVFASEPIPGNEQNVYAVIDTISHNGSEVAYSDIVSDLHASGHSSSIEQKLLISLLNPQHLVPIGGTFHHMIEYRKLARSLGYADHHIHLLDSGNIIAFEGHRGWVDQTIELQNVMVDGLGVGDVGHIVLRDRQQMAADGILAILVPVEQQTGLVKGEVEVISRGFVYVKKSSAIIDDIKRAAAATLEHRPSVVTDWQSIRKKIETTIEQLIYDRTERRPLLLTVIIEV
jgi:ribonuclease J